MMRLAVLKRRRASSLRRLGESLHISQQASQPSSLPLLFHDSRNKMSRPANVKLVLLGKSVIALRGLRSHFQGEAAVGKSSLCLRFVQSDFQENKEPTVSAVHHESQSIRYAHLIDRRRFSDAEMSN